MGARGLGCRHDDEVGPSQVLVQIGWAVEFVDALRCLGDARINADDAHAEMRTMACRGPADAADADNEGGGFGQVHRITALAALEPFAAELGREIALHAAGKDQHKSHYVVADVIVVDAARIGDGDRTGNQFGKIKARTGAGGRAGQPVQLWSGFEQLGVHSAKGASGRG